MDDWKKIYNSLLNHGYSKGQAAAIIGRCYRLAMSSAVNALLEKSAEDAKSGIFNDEEACD